jgi:hypothetical protein
MARRVVVGQRLVPQPLVVDGAGGGQRVQGAALPAVELGGDDAGSQVGDLPRLGQPVGGVVDAAPDQGRVVLTGSSSRRGVRDGTSGGRGDAGADADRDCVRGVDLRR